VTVGRSGREVLGGGGALPVDVTALGRELRRLWEQDGPEGAPGRPVITRACTRNLIALAHSPEEAERATRLIADLAGVHPTRAFVVEAAGGDPAQLEAHLIAHCSIRVGGRHVCCEQISLTVGAAARRRAAGTILPLLVPDLPVFVWVLGEPAWDDPLFARVLDVADRLVIDSRAAADPRALLRRLAEGPGEDAWAPGDFEWSRLAGWREAVASLFDEPATSALPQALEEVHVTHGAGGAAIGPALLAGWSLDRIASARGRAEARSGPEPKAVLTPVDGAAPGEIVSLRLVARTPRASCEVAIEVGDSGLTARVDLEDACPLPARHPHAVFQDEHLLENQLDVAGPSMLYERALARAAALLG
jgi:glucose-6-phosphate dehydrogenase assembly protein OpcA